MDDTFKDKLDWYKTYTRGYIKDNLNMYNRDEVGCNTDDIMVSRGREFTFKPETPKQETEKPETTFTFNDVKIIDFRQNSMLVIDE